MINVEIWASGGGTNADAILQYFKSIDDIAITGIGCNRMKAGAFDVAKKHNVPGHYWSNDTWKPDEILTQLKNRKIDFLVLAGFLKLVPQEVVQAYKGKIINIHPSLLPKYGGANMYGEFVHRAVLSAHEIVSGITIHEVNEQFDKGKILAQYTVSLQPNDDLGKLKSKIQHVEHKHFAPTIEAWIRSVIL